MFLYVLSLKLSKKIIVWGKIVVLVVLVAYIAHVIRHQDFNWGVVQQQVRTVRQPGKWAIGLLMLTPVNWGFEALKWQILLQRLERVTFWSAYQGVLAGVSLGFALPAQLGDTAGRVLSLRTNRASAVGASLVSGGMQFYVALVFGAFAWMHHLASLPDRNTSAGRLLLAVLLFLSALGVVFGMLRRPLIGWLERKVRNRTFATYWTIAGQYTNQEIGWALMAATLRYVIFSTQFYLALRLLGIDLPLDVAASGIGLVFLVKTMTPAFNLLSDLGVREAASLWVFAPFAIPAPVLLMATLTLWLTNVLMPVLVGLIWVWKLKWTAE